MFRTVQYNSENYKISFSPRTFKDWGHLDDEDALRLLTYPSLELTFLPSSLPVASTLKGPVTYFIKMKGPERPSAYSSKSEESEFRRVLDAGLNILLFSSLVRETRKSRVMQRRSCTSDQYNIFIIIINFLGCINL